MSVTSNEISAFLGIRASGGLALISEVKKGLPSEVLDRVASAIAPSDHQFIYKIVPRATLARRRKTKDTRLSATEGSRLARLASVWTTALEVWGSIEAARAFMFNPHPLLESRRPVDVVLESEFGRPEVEAILGRLQYGSAV